MIFLRSKRLEKKTSDAREPSLYRSICTSIISTLLSLVMLVGTTFAWFTDSITSNVFTITAGNFPAKTYYWVGSGEPTEFPSDETNREATTGGWQDVEENAAIFNGMQFNSEGSSQSPQTVYLALVNKSDQNAATCRFYFESVAESNSAGSNNIRDALTFTCALVEKQEDNGAIKWVSTSEGTKTKKLSDFTTTSGDGTAIQNPFVVEVEKKTTKYVALTIDVDSTVSEEIASSSIQLRLQIDITSGGGSANAALTTVRKTMRRPADRDEYSIADDSGVVTIIQTKPPVTEKAETDDTDTSGAAEDGGNADTSGGAVDTAADTAAVEPNAADDAPAADSAA